MTKKSRKGRKGFIILLAMMLILTMIPTTALAMDELPIGDVPPVEQPVEDEPPVEGEPPVEDEPAVEGEEPVEDEPAVDNEPPVEEKPMMMAKKPGQQQWPQKPEKTPLVSWFVRFDGAIVDTSGNVSSHDTSLYTPALRTSEIVEEDGYDIEDEIYRTGGGWGGYGHVGALTDNASIEALATQNAARGYYIDDFLGEYDDIDALVDWLEDNPRQRIYFNDHNITADLKANPDKYDIEWYVFKSEHTKGSDYDENNCYHIDGVVVMRPETTEDLIISKTFIGADAAAIAKAERVFSIDVTDEAGEPVITLQTTSTVGGDYNYLVSKITGANVVGEDTVSKTYTWVLTLPKGEYTASESTAAPDGYTMVAEILSDTADITSGAGEIVFTNIYTAIPPKVGNLEITKTVAEGYTVPAAATFAVKDADGRTVRTFTYADFVDGVYTVRDLGIGYYTIEETGAEIEGTIWNYSVEYADGEVAEVVNKGTAKVEVYNGYELLPPPPPPAPELGDAAVRVYLDGQLVQRDLTSYVGLEAGTAILLGEAEIAAYQPAAPENKTVSYDEAAANVTSGVIEAYKVILLDLYFVTEDIELPPPPVEYTSLAVQKVWNLEAGGEPTDYVKVQLYKDGEPQGAVKLDAANNWSYTWEELEVGYTYTVVEVAVPDGFTATQETVNGVVVITNTYVPPTPPQPPVEPEYTSITVRKAWVLDNGGEAVPVQVQLYRDDVPYGQPIELSEANQWTCTWDGLLLDGSSYGIKEIEVEGFTVTYGEDETGTIVITNDDIAKEEPPVTPPPVDPPVNPPVDPPYYPPYYPPYEPPVEPPVVIEEPEVPLVDEPVIDEPVEIEEPEVPLAEAPKTGDNMMTWAMIALLSLVGLLALGRRKNETNN